MNKLVVVAIDFGTTYSGWAFSCRHDYENDPTKVFMKTWQGGQLISLKRPTCILIQPDGKTMDSFGYDAEYKYAELAEDNRHDSWFFFRRFKMMLFKDKGMDRSATLEDESGKKLPAMTVFSLFIGYLTREVLEFLSRQVVPGPGVSDIHWVLTVPAIWNDTAKQFMREAAQNAGIPGKNLTICLEPEAASIYCRHLPVSKSSTKGEKASLAQFSAGTKYLVLDAGGGVVDVTVHEVTKSGKLKEVHKASGGAWGGTKVDQAYEQFLTNIVGPDVFQEFKNNHMVDYIEVFRDFEIKKRDISSSKQEKITIRMPANLSSLCSEMKRCHLKDIINQSPFSDKIKLFKDKMKIDSAVFREFFKPTVRSIIDHVAAILKEPTVFGCDTILMVGGFSKSPVFQEERRANFPNIRIISPEDADLAILKGAVIFGHETSAITERVCKYTYGIETTHKYDNCEHPKGRIEKDRNGDLRCYDIFKIHAKAGQSVKLNEEQPEEVYRPITDDQTEIGFNIYSSSKTEPHFITENGCSRIGSLTIPITDTRLGRSHKFGSSFIFGGTEIVVKVVDKVTGDVTYETIDFLDSL